jgi:hypothetical protein
LTAPAALDSTPVGGQPVSSTHQPLTLVAGDWTGTETATVGESGKLKVNLTQLPTPGQEIAATLVWTSALTSLSYEGTLTGTLDQMVITASNNPGGHMCGYRAIGALNQEGTEITGTYSGVGPNPCPTKSGSFVLRRQPIPPPPPVTECPATFIYNGPNPFELPNSSDASELAYVRSNVSSALSSAGKVSLTGKTEWTSDGNYAVVIVKSGTVWFIYTNVSAGDVLQSPAVNSQGKRQEISHVSRFACVEGAR